MEYLLFRTRSIGWLWVICIIICISGLRCDFGSLWYYYWWWERFGGSYSGSNRWSYCGVSVVFHSIHSKSIRLKILDQVWIFFQVLQVNCNQILIQFGAVIMFGCSICSGRLRKHFRRRVRHAGHRVEWVRASAVLKYAIGRERFYWSLCCRLLWWRGWECLCGWKLDGAIVFGWRMLCRWTQLGAGHSANMQRSIRKYPNLRGSIMPSTKPCNNPTL